MCLYYLKLTFNSDAALAEDTRSHPADSILAGLIQRTDIGTQQNNQTVWIRF